MHQAARLSFLFGQEGGPYPRVSDVQTWCALQQAQEPVWHAQGFFQQRTSSLHWIEFLQQVAISNIE